MLSPLAISSEPCLPSDIWLQGGVELPIHSLHFPCENEMPQNVEQELKTDGASPFGIDDVSTKES